jgi:hypothetical protein
LGILYYCVIVCTIMGTIICGRCTPYCARGAQESKDYEVLASFLAVALVTGWCQVPAVQLTSALAGGVSNRGSPVKLPKLPPSAPWAFFFPHASSASSFFIPIFAAVLTHFPSFHRTIWFLIPLALSVAADFTVWPPPSAFLAPTAAYTAFGGAKQARQQRGTF